MAIRPVARERSAFDILDVTDMSDNLSHRKRRGSLRGPETAPCAQARRTPLTA